MVTDEEITKNLTMIEYYKEQLGSIDIQIQYFQAAVADYQKAKLSIEQLDKTKGKPDILIPVGTGIFVYASAKETSKILIDIGDGIVAEKTVDEALKKVDSRIEVLQKNQEKLLAMAQQMQQEAVDLSNKTQALINETKK